MHVCMITDHKVDTKQYALHARQFVHAVVLIGAEISDAARSLDVMSICAFSADPIAA